MGNITTEKGELRIWPEMLTSKGEDCMFCGTQTERFLRIFKLFARILSITWTDFLRKPARKTDDAFLMAGASAMRKRNSLRCPQLAAASPWGEAVTEGDG